MLRYLSVCSGVEAATVAWHPLGWEAVGFSEIESFPAAVLAHHYPSVPNFGDLTKHETWNLAPGSVDLLVGGTPCQAFSVAGKRAGLDDPRGQLMLAYLDLARRLRPLWIVWENVPGVLSSNRGRDFGALLGGLEHLGYGWAFRVLDAQWVRTQRHPRAVPQRRRRVFVVGCLGDATSAAAVLFERESVQRNPAKGGKARQGATADAGGGAPSGSGREWPVIWREGDQANASHCVDFAGTLNCDKGQQGSIIAQPVNPAVATTLSARDHKGPSCGRDGVVGNPVVVAQTPAFPIQDGRELDKRQNGLGIGDANDPAYTVDCTGAQAVAHAQAVAFQLATSLAVRRLTPRECERLQGFPDDYTAIVYRGKPAADGPRYKAMGNSMAVNCMAWIGERIAAVDDRLRGEVQP